MKTSPLAPLLKGEGKNHNILCSFCVQVQIRIVIANNGFYIAVAFYAKDNKNIGCNAPYLFFALRNLRRVAIDNRAFGRTASNDSRCIEAWSFKKFSYPRHCAFYFRRDIVARNCCGNNKKPRDCSVAYCVPGNSFSCVDNRTGIGYSSVQYTAIYIFVIGNTAGISRFCH
jgi:hypothetical protein